MALLSAQINFEKSKLPTNFLSNLSKILAEIFEEPIEVRFWFFSWASEFVANLMILNLDPFLERQRHSG